MLNSIIGTSLSLGTFLICTAVSLVLGLGVAAISTFKSSSTGSLAVTLAVLPAVVQVVIMLVNGNIGTGVAVAGAFGLVRFRSAPGTAKEIALIFLAMAIGLATGMGYVAIAAVFFVIIAAVIIVLSLTNFCRGDELERILKVTIPENLDYEGLLDDLFNKYTKKHSLNKVKTSNMGTLYELNYRITLNKEICIKPFLDEIRCRNGNLNVVCCRESEREIL